MPSQEQKTEIERYQALLEHWGRSISLFADWKRLTSYHLPLCHAFAHALHPFREHNILDIGSGNGMPGVFLSLHGFQHVHLIEPNYKKVVFLKTVIRELHLRAVVYAQRFEQLDLASICQCRRPILMVARAVAPLTQCVRWMLEASKRTGLSVTGAFLKGDRYLEELQQAQQHAAFIWNLHPISYGQWIQISDVVESSHIPTRISLLPA